MPQSGKVIQPGVLNPRSVVIIFCALKGRRDADLPTSCAPSGRKPVIPYNLGFKTPGCITLPLCGIRSTKLALSVHCERAETLTKQALYSFHASIVTAQSWLFI
ncbi:MAG: hypothetical protein GY795_40905 [Desulfobacterales bacterium]|nr:hypothetical protein [Desulfobacterales bacterium]